MNDFSLEGIVQRLKPVAHHHAVVIQLSGHGERGLPGVVYVGQSLNPGSSRGVETQDQGFNSSVSSWTTNCLMSLLVNFTTWALSLLTAQEVNFHNVQKFWKEAEL